MSEDTKKVEQIEQEGKASELSDQDLENAAGGINSKVYPPSTGCTDPHCGINPPPPSF